MLNVVGYWLISCPWWSFIISCLWLLSNGINWAISDRLTVWLGLHSYIIISSFTQSCGHLCMHGILLVDTFKHIHFTCIHARHNKQRDYVKRSSMLMLSGWFYQILNFILNIDESWTSFVVSAEALKRSAAKQSQAKDSWSRPYGYDCDLTSLPIACLYRCSLFHVAGKWRQ